jgi:hypothetical protein
MTEAVSVAIPEPNIQAFKVTLKGTAPLIHHEWSEKAKKQIRDKQQKKASKAHGKRNPNGEYEASKIKNSKGKLAIKAIWIKKAVVAAARNIDGVPMTLLRGAVFVRGDEDGLIPLRYKKEKMVEDVVRLSGGTSDLRYRPYIHDWEADVEIQHNADVLSTEQVVNLLKIAGFACGIGERRPGKSGEDYGTFDVLAIKKK